MKPGPAVRPLTAHERRTVRALRKLAKDWPPSLWVFAGVGFYLMQTDTDGNRPETKFGSVSPDYIVERFDIPNDGGDW